MSMPPEGLPPAGTPLCQAGVFRQPVRRLCRVSPGPVGVDDHVGIYETGHPLNRSS